MHYLGPDCGLEDPFTYQPTEQQLEMIKAIGHAIEFGGDQALAASRGEGKTTYCERLALKYILQGKIKYAVIFQATGDLAQDCLDSIKEYIENNTKLREDYPEVCYPVIALAGASVSGFRHDNGKPYEMASSKFTWSSEEVIFPRVPGSPSAKAIIKTRGLDSAVRGLKKRGYRVGLTIIDDPDTESTAENEEQAAKLEKRIDAAIAGLGGQKKQTGRVMITTIQSPISVSFKFTDPKQKESFKGKRFRFLIRRPTNEYLCDEYVQLWKDDMTSGDPHCRRACRFYLEKREEMDLGAKVSNPNRFDADKLPDGTQIEYSALQRYFNLVAKLGKEIVAAEYDNDPIVSDAIVEDDLKPTRVQKKVNGFERRAIPPGCVLLTQGIDVRKRALHWVVRAWRLDGTGFTIDYGVFEILGTTYGSNEGVDQAVQRAILSRLEESKEAKYRFEDGQELQIDLTLIDAGWMTAAVYGACVIAGVGVLPVQGFGKSSGCVQANFHDALKSTVDRKPGDNWFLSRKQKFVKFEQSGENRINEIVSRMWLVCANVDHWKRWEHDRWRTDIGSVGSMSLFGEAGDDGERMSKDQREHHSYAHHICNEPEVEKLKKGRLVRFFEAKSENTHWLDSSVYADVAASIRGITLGGVGASVNRSKIAGAQQNAASKDRKSLAQLAEEAKHGRAS
jgi:hypothetical protein